MTLDEALARPTLSIPDAGRVFYGSGRNGSYEAAKSGALPTIEVNGRKLALVASIAKQFGLRTKFESAA